jgi:LacI family transcriptional regulator
MIRIQLKQIAEEAQVSTTLVSQVLNKRDVRVAAETRERILRIAERYHYLPNRLAAGLKLKRTNTIAVLVPFTSAGFFSELIYHIEAYAMERGFNSLVINTFGERDKETKGLQLYKSQLADGFLVPAKRPTASTPLRPAASRSIPFCICRPVCRQCKRNHSIVRPFLRSLRPHPKANRQGTSEYPLRKASQRARKFND